MNEQNQLSRDHLSFRKGHDDKLVFPFEVSCYDLPKFLRHLFDITNALKTTLLESELREMIYFRFKMFFTNIFHSRFLKFFLSFVRILT